MSDRKSTDAFISEQYGVSAEFPWIQYPTFATYRHSSNEKWFAVIMDLPKTKFGFNDETVVSVVNLKCDPIMIGSLCMEDGIFPAYHMNKNYWISVFLDNSVEDEKVKMLIDISYNLTDKRKPKKKYKDDF